MTNDQIVKFLGLLHVLINSGGTWQEKKERIESEACESDLSNIEEFCVWFNVEE